MWLSRRKAILDSFTVKVCISPGGSQMKVPASAHSQVFRDLEDHVLREILTRKAGWPDVLDHTAHRLAS